MSNLTKLLVMGIITSVSVCSATDIKKDMMEEEKETLPLYQSVQVNGLKDESDLLELLKKQDISIGQKKYGLIIDDTVRNAILQHFLEKKALEEAFEKIANKNPSKKVVGYSLGLYKNKIIIESFLGDNAK